MLDDNSEYQVDTTRDEIEGCNCTLRERLVGDGCPKCNPELWEELLAQQDEETIEEIFLHEGWSPYKETSE